MSVLDEPRGSCAVGGLDSGDGDLGGDSNTWLSSSGNKLSGFLGKSTTAISRLSVGTWTGSKFFVDDAGDVGQAADSFEMRTRNNDSEVSRWRNEY